MPVAAVGGDCSGDWPDWHPEILADLPHPYRRPTGTCGSTRRVRVPQMLTGSVPQRPTSFPFLFTPLSCSRTPRNFPSSSFSALLSAPPHASSDTSSSSSSSCCCHTQITRRLHSSITHFSIENHTSLIAARDLSLIDDDTSLALCLRRARWSCSFAIHDSFISNHFKRQTPIGLDRSAHSDRVSLTQQPLQSKHQNKSIGVLCCTGTVLLSPVLLLLLLLHCTVVTFRASPLSRAHTWIYFYLTFFLLLLLLLLLFPFYFCNANALGRCAHKLE